MTSPSGACRHAVHTNPVMITEKAEPFHPWCYRVVPQHSAGRSNRSPNVGTARRTGSKTDLNVPTVSIIRRRTRHPR